MAGWLGQLLQKTTQALWSPLRSGETRDCLLDEDWLEQFEEHLLKADVGLPVTLALTEALRLERNRLTTWELLHDWLKQWLMERLNRPYLQSPAPLQPTALWHPPAEALTVLLLLGVNGAGKTSLAAKLAYHYRQLGRPVTLAAADTFRAAADEQLAIWADRVDCPLVRLKPGSDPAAVAYQAVEQAKAQQHPGGVVIIDTAGRLPNQQNLLDQLTKVVRVVERQLPEGANRHALAVLEAATGQNALHQLGLFQQAVPLAGVALTKLDGSAKGGIAFALAEEKQLPLLLLTHGEQLPDVHPFSAEPFVEALLAPLLKTV